MEIATLNVNQMNAFRGIIPKDIFYQIEKQENILAFGGVENGVPCGVLVFALEQQQIRIIWLYVAEEFQGKGIGRILVRALEEKAFDDPQVDYLIMDVADSSPIDPMYMLLLTEGWTPIPFELSAYSCTLEQILKIPFWKQKIKDNNIYPLDQIPSWMLKEYGARLQKNEDMPSIPFPIDNKDYETQISMGYIKEDKIGAIVLFTQEEDELVLNYAHAQSDASIGFVKMIYTAFQRALEKYPPETEVSFATITPIAQKLAEKLLPVCKAQPMYRMRFPVKKRMGGGSVDG